MNTQIIKFISDFGDVNGDYKAGLYSEIEFLHKIYEISVELCDELKETNTSYMVAKRYRDWKERKWNKPYFVKERVDTQGFNVKKLWDKTIGKFVSWREMNIE